MVYASSLCYKLARKFFLEGIIQAYDFFRASVKRFSKITSFNFRATYSKMFGFCESPRTDIAGKLSELGTDSPRRCICFTHPAPRVQSSLRYHFRIPNWEGIVSSVRTDSGRAGCDAMPTSSQHARFTVSSRTDETVTTHP